MKIKITNKSYVKNAWWNDYVGKEFESLSLLNNGQVTVTLPNSNFKLPILGLVWRHKTQKFPFTQGIVPRSFYEIVKEKDNERN